MTKNKEIEKTKVEGDIEIQEIDETSSFYYFYSVGCAFCKKIEPIIDELNEEGYDILKLDMAEPDNQKLSGELKQEYNKKCGTPWLIDAETGNQICGFRDKDTIKEWLGGKDFPTPKPPTRMAPKIPINGASEIEVENWKKDYEEWAEENKHLPNLMKAEELLAKPRLNSQAPPFPTATSTDEELDEWKEKYEKWRNENSHIPNLQPPALILDRIRSAQNSMNIGTQANNPAVNTLSAKVNALEVKVDKLMAHFGVK